jgi:hypothetical protein
MALSAVLDEYLEVSSGQTNQELASCLTKTEVQVDRLRKARLQEDKEPEKTLTSYLLQGVEYITDTPVGTTANSTKEAVDPMLTTGKLLMSLPSLVSPDPLTALGAAADALSATMDLVSASDFCPTELKEAMKPYSAALNSVKESTPFMLMSKFNTKHERFTNPDVKPFSMEWLADMGESIAPHLADAKLTVLSKVRDYTLAHSQAEKQEEKSKVLAESEKFKDLIEELKKQSGAFGEQIKFYHKMQKNDFKDSKIISKK